MKRLGQRYVQYINRTYQRSGTLWEGRFRSCLVNEEHYLLGCYRYIELNPVRAGMVAHPAAYRWCSYRANAQGEHIEWLDAHPLYHALGHTPAACQKAYRELFKDQLASGLADQIRHATNGNYALGSERFRQEAAAVLGRRVSRDYRVDRETRGKKAKTWSVPVFTTGIPGIFVSPPVIIIMRDTPITILFICDSPKKMPVINRHL